MEYLKSYLGDGVYVSFNEYQQIVLTTEDGVGASNIIYMELEVLRKFEQWTKRMAAEVARLIAERDGAPKEPGND
jgi:hypothetical protein